MRGNHTWRWAADCKQARTQMHTPTHQVAQSLAAGSGAIMTRNRRLHCGSWRRGRKNMQSAQHAAHNSRRRRHAEQKTCRCRRAKPGGKHTHAERTQHLQQAQQQPATTTPVYAHSQTQCQPRCPPWFSHIHAALPAFRLPACRQVIPKAPQCMPMRQDCAAHHHAMAEKIQAHT